MLSHEEHQPTGTSTAVETNHGGAEVASTKAKAAVASGADPV